MQRFGEFEFENQVTVPVVVELEANSVQRQYTVPPGETQTFDPSIFDVQTILIAVRAESGFADQFEELSVLALPERAYIRRARAVFDGSLHGHVDAAY